MVGPRRRFQNPFGLLTRLELKYKTTRRFAHGTTVRHCGGPYLGPSFLTTKDRRQRIAQRQAKTHMAAIQAPCQPKVCAITSCHAIHEIEPTMNTTEYVQMIRIRSDPPRLEIIHPPDRTA